MRPGHAMAVTPGGALTVLRCQDREMNRREDSDQSAEAAKKISGDTVSLMTPLSVGEQPGRAGDVRTVTPPGRRLARPGTLPSVCLC